MDGKLCYIVITGSLLASMIKYFFLAHTKVKSVGASIETLLPVAMTRMTSRISICYHFSYMPAGTWLSATL